MTNWNPAHALMIQHRKALDVRIANAQVALTDARQAALDREAEIDRAAVTKKAIEEAIRACNFTTPEGFDLFGDPLE